MHSRIEYLEGSLLGTDDSIGPQLISLADFKAELGITTTTEDAANSSRITRASKLIAEECGRRFAMSDAQETFIFERLERARPRQALALRLYPIIQIFSVTIDGVEVDETEYDFDQDSGLIWLVDGCWHGRVVVTYSGGYDLPDGAPGALQQACVELVRQFRNSGASLGGVSVQGSGIREIDHGDTRVVFDNGSSSSFSSSSSSSSGSALPAFVLDLLGPFKRMALG